MVETDWREILSFSQRELVQADKEKLCESLCWMEADDIELNFTDLKTLFRLAQDILKFKSEQVNNLLGKLETSHRKAGKSKSKSTSVESPASTESALETIAHQEEVIKANKEILEQLYADIAKLEGRKDRYNVDQESESSRDALSEMDAMAELENQLTAKNRHIRKLLADVKVVEEENTKLKEKVSVLKDKLTEATQIIENLTEQMLGVNNENTRLKEILGKSEQAKAQLSVELDSVRKELFEKDSTRDNIYEEIKSKVQHWKNAARTKKVEIEALTYENVKLKENLIRISQSSTSSPKTKSNIDEEQKIKELQEKLSEAANEIIESANLIEVLKAENKQLKETIEEAPDYSVSDTKNESDDGKERIMINKLKKKVKNLTATLQGTEEMVAIREKELSEITSQLQMLRTDEGINALLEGLKNKKHQLKIQDEGIKSLVQQINTLNELVNNLQLENETMREKLHLPQDEKISTQGILKKYTDLQKRNSELTKEIRQIENKLVTVEIDNRDMNLKLSRLVERMINSGISQDKVNEICQGKQNEDYNIMPTNGGGEASTILASQNKQNIEIKEQEAEMQAIIEENEGLRKGLQEILDFLKDNSTTSSGILALECPSLEAILQSMEARHAAGWFAPHMAAVMALRTALGGKDALLTALHEARKETYEVMTQLSKESLKSKELEKKLKDIETQSNAKLESENIVPTIANAIPGEFGTWMSDKEQNNIDLYDKVRIENMITKRNFIHEEQLRNGLIYFHIKFKALYDKMTSIAIQAADDQNKWSVQEEQYKAQIENLEIRLIQNEDEDTSEPSPGLISIPSISCLERKCSYLEDSYKYIRTLNENLKNEYLESKRETMILAGDYESQIQKLMLSVANLTDKLRGSISVDLFWKQNEVLNEIITKFRKQKDENFNRCNEKNDLLKCLENDRIDVINTFQQEVSQYRLTEQTIEDNKLSTLLSKVEQSIFAKQLQEVCSELDTKNNEIKNLEAAIVGLQEAQSKLIDKTLASATQVEVDQMKEEVAKLTEENKVLKEQCRHVEGQLDIALLQLQDRQQRQLSDDMEVNLLRHQILDLQSTGDNKAIVARLSGEVLVAHLQASECNKKIERLNSALNKEKLLRAETEEMLRARQNIFDIYCCRFESKFRYIYEVMQVLRQQYQSTVPVVSIENYLNNVEDISRKSFEVNAKLDEIEELQSSLMRKHSVFDQILDVSKNKCLEEKDGCPHKLQNLMAQGIYSREVDHYKKKLEIVEQCRQDLLKRCNNLERTLVLVNRGFEKSSLDDVIERKNPDAYDGEKNHNLEVEDVESDDESHAKRSQTITLPKPQLLKPSKSNVDMTMVRKEDTEDLLIGSPVRSIQMKHNPEVISVLVQTSFVEEHKKSKLIQTDEDQEINEMKRKIGTLMKSIDKKSSDLNEAIKLAQERSEYIHTLNKEKMQLESSIQILQESNYQRDKLNENLQFSIKELKRQVEDYKNTHIEKQTKNINSEKEDNKSLVIAIKRLENEKNVIVADYKELLNKEREEYSKAVKTLNKKVIELQSQLDSRNESESNSVSSEALKGITNKYTSKIADLEDKCFKLQSELDGYKSEVTSYQSEVERWKGLATERLSKMEQLNSQLEERHSHEVESYKAENDHWLAQITENQREHLELRSRLTEQKALFVKQLADKDAHIEQLRSVVHGLKTQIMSMQTMISVTDPSFDLSAIVEVDEGSDPSQHGSDRLERSNYSLICGLELKFDSSVDLHDMPDDFARTQASSTAIWQEPIIERLRREKQLTAKQNAILRRQIKALAARERRARLDAQNLRNQVFRISTSGSKGTTAETTALHSKIASLQAQLTSARRDSHSTVALWDKWKRAQQASERWQSKYEEKCQETKKLEASLNLAKSAIGRLEKEKRVLLTRLNEVKDEKLFAIEKQDREHSEKSRARSPTESAYSDAPVTSRALLERVEAQQRRIAALEVAEKGNEYLVSEYEKALSEITALKGQVLKLESTLLECQIRTPLKSTQEQNSEVDYWKSYCEMLKEENVQLNLRVNAMETLPCSAGPHQSRTNDLEQTVLTLRGLVSKLQAEQKSGHLKRPDSRPNSGRSGTEKGRGQLESYRIEIANLKRTIQDKDLLLERSKEMLKIAAEREDDLLRENASLRRELDKISKYKRGFLSA